MALTSPTQDKSSQKIKHLLDKLNPSQREAVMQTEGRLLILAGAGSGKTSVLAHRMAYMIAEKGIDPASILGLTFTNKAAQEMRERMGKMVGKAAAKKLTLSTFHSFCMRVLRKEIEKIGYTNNFTLYTEKESGRLLTSLIRQMLEHEGNLPSLTGTVEKLTSLKSKGSTAEEVAQQICMEHPQWHDKFTQELLANLEKSMRAYNAVDFDSLLSLTLQLFREHPETLKKYQQIYKYIMIDEYQDTSQVQYQMTALIAQEHGNLCVVGDDDQSIYSWRGAEIKHILEFNAEKVVKLEQNYRSTPTILHAANSVIRNNKERHSKALFSAGDPGEPVELFCAPTETDEATALVERLIHYKIVLNIPWNEIAILYRSNILSRGFETALTGARWEKNGQWMHGIPYKVHGGMDFFERSEIKDLAAYLRVLTNPKDEEALLRIINLPRRGISGNSLDLLTKKSRKEEKPLWFMLVEIAKSDEPFVVEGTQLSDKAQRGIKGFVNLITEGQKLFQEKQLSSALSTFLDLSHFRKSIEEEVKSEKMRGFKWENVMQCVQSVQEYEQEMIEEEQENAISLSDFLSKAMLDSNGFETRKEQKNHSGVNLMTFHSAKGLEFSLCFLVCLEDHILPHEKSVGVAGIEEERRLFYVAMTRAKRQLVLSMAKMRKRAGKESKSTPSRFLFEIPKELLKVTTWNERRW